MDRLWVQCWIANKHVELGALVDLSKVDVLFPPDKRGKNTYHAYALGFTRCYGNVQA